MVKYLVAAALGLSAMAAPAIAGTVDIGNLYQLNGNGAYAHAEDFTGGPGGVATSYTFTLSHDAVLHALLTDTARLTGLTASIYSVGAAGDVLETSLGALNGSGASDSWQSGSPLSMGSYRVDVIGNYLTRGSYSLELSADTAAPVPGPAGFVVAGVGALVLAARRRRSKVNVAIA